MPELPDLRIYQDALETHVVGHTLVTAHLQSAFLLRSVDPPLEVFHGRILDSVGRIGKRLTLGFAGDMYLAIHLMIAGRLKWTTKHAARIPKNAKLALRFDHGRLDLTEVSKKQRAAVTACVGREQIRALDRGGVEPLDSDIEKFARALRSRNHTLKRALCDPTIVSGIGNAYSDEILHRARLSPFKLTNRLSDDEIAKLHKAAAATLTEWTERLREQTGTRFPSKVTAFRPEMAVHGKARSPCPVCGTRVQRIVYAENECNYCPECQTGGKLLRDRALSRLLKDDWPRSLAEMDDLVKRAKAASPDR